MLASGSEEVIRQLAADDIRGAKNEIEQLALGDRWWERAKDAKGRKRIMLQTRAVHWYRQALPVLKGLAKAKVEARVVEAKPANGPVPPHRSAPPISGPPTASPIQELNGRDDSAFPWIAPDGLTIYLEESATIWSAVRQDTTEKFGSKTFVTTGRHPTLTGDQQELIFALDGKLVTATGDGKDITAIHSFKNVLNPKMPSISTDGLRLIFAQYAPDKAPQLMISTRSTRKLSWSRPTALPVKSSRTLLWPYLTDDGLLLICTDMDKEIVLSKRKELHEPFEEFKMFSCRGLPAMHLRRPHYVPLTNELFLSGRAGPNTSFKEQLYVVKNFDPQALFR